MKKSLYPVLMTIVLLLGACGRQPVREAVEWPGMRDFDEVTGQIAVRAELGLAPEEARVLFGDVKAAFQEVQRGGVPENAWNRETVLHQLEEMEALLEEVDREETITAEHLTRIDDLAHRIVETAGVPHEHHHPGHDPGH